MVLVKTILVGILSHLSANESFVNESVFIFVPKSITHIDIAYNFQTNIYHHLFTLFS